MTRGVFRLFSKFERALLAVVVVVRRRRRRPSASSVVVCRRPWVLDAVVRTVCGPGPPYNVGEGFMSGGAGPWSLAGGGCFFNRPAVFPF